MRNAVMTHVLKYFRLATARGGLSIFFFFTFHAAVSDCITFGFALEENWKHGKKTKKTSLVVSSRRRGHISVQHPHSFRFESLRALRLKIHRHTHTHTYRVTLYSPQVPIKWYMGSEPFISDKRVNSL